MTTIVVVVIDIYLYDYYYVTGHSEMPHGSESLARFKKRVRELTRRTRTIGMDRMVNELSVYLRGWLDTAASQCGGIRPASSGERRRQVPPAAICASLGNAMTTSAKGRSGDSPGYRMPGPLRARDSRDRMSFRSRHGRSRESV